MKTLTHEQYQKLPIEEQGLYELYRCSQSALFPDFYRLKQPIEIAPDTVEQETPREKYLREQREAWENHKADIAKRMSEAKTIEEVAEIKYPFVDTGAGYNHRDTHNYIAKHKREGFLEGANWQSTNSDNISRAKVLEILEAWVYSSKIEGPISLISKIKGL